MKKRQQTKVKRIKETHKHSKHKNLQMKKTEKLKR